MGFALGEAELGGFEADIVPEKADTATALGTFVHSCFMEDAIKSAHGRVHGEYTALIKKADRKDTVPKTYGNYMLVFDDFAEYSKGMSCLKDGDGIELLKKLVVPDESVEGLCVRLDAKVTAELSERIQDAEPKSDLDEEGMTFIMSAGEDRAELLKEVFGLETEYEGGGVYCVKKKRTKRSVTKTYKLPKEKKYKEFSPTSEAAAETAKSTATAQTAYSERPSNVYTKSQKCSPIGESSSSKACAELKMSKRSKMSRNKLAAIGAAIAVIGIGAAICLSISGASKKKSGQTAETDRANQRVAAAKRRRGKRGRALLARLADFVLRP